ncbi:MAG: hypothetical protein H6529_14220 [Nocardioides sp.]|nr:hypothetical protein [Nocardioides sp.]
MSELVCIAVPGMRLDATFGLLRVVLTPRLSTADHLVDWPKVLHDGAQVELQVTTSAGVDLPAQVVDVTHQADSDVWHRFFDRITVTPWTGVPSYGTVTATDTASHADQASTVYGAAVSSVGDPATVEPQLAALDLEPLPPPPDPLAPVPAWTRPDFHRALALLRSFPAVMRALGLVVDVAVPRTLIDQAGPSGRIRAVWRRPPTGFGVTAPATAFEVVDGFFAPMRSATIVGGFVDLRTTSAGPDGAPVPDWPVVTFDVDGAAGALRDLQGSVARRRARAGAAGGLQQAALDPDDVALPGRRSLGLQIVHRQRQQHLDDRAARGRARAHQGLDDADALTADDLVLGYRLDVSEPGGRWYSAMRRSATYLVDGEPIQAEPVEEGHIAAGAVVRGTDNALRTDGVVVRWDGSRLGVPARRPGTTPAPRPAAPHADMPYDFVWHHDVAPDEPAGWRPLRFSLSYQLRLRVADIAGGGLEVGDVSSARYATDDVTYLRHEPVLPPEMPPPAGLLGTVPGGDGAVEVDHDLLGPGGALDRLVIRSDPAGDEPLPAYPANDSRVFLPPTATFELSDWEGRLDGDDVAAWRLARRALAAPRASAEARNGRQYTWLPDPAADQMAVTVLPVAADPVSGPTRERWALTPWPDYPGKTVRVVPSGEMAPTVDFAQVGTATVAMPAGHRVRVEVSSAVKSEQFARFDAISDAVPNSAAHDAVVDGRHPVVTPARTVDVVHAVRRPLLAPAAVLQAERDIGATAAVVDDDASPRYGVDPHSTQQIDVTASWVEVVDDGSQVVPTPVSMALPPLPVPVDGSPVASIRHDFGDTRHRSVSYRLDARSRYREFFATTDPDAAFVHSTPFDPIHVDSTARPPAPVVVSVAPAIRLEEGSGTVSRAPGLLRVELDGPWFVTGEGEQLGLVVPPAPGAVLERLDGGDELVADVGSPLVTTVYRDPLHGTDGPRQVDSGGVAGAAGEPVVVTDLETGTPICVVPFDVTCVDGRRSADIDLGSLADETDRPMVRLALVRFQRHSLRGLTTSPVVRTDLVGLLHGRTVRARVEAAEPIFVGPGTTGDTLVVVQLGGDPVSREVELRVEWCAAAPPDDALTATTDVAGDAVWTVLASGSGPANPHTGDHGLTFTRQASGEHRLVVTEWDDLPPSSAVTPDDLGSHVSRRPIFIAALSLTADVSALPSAFG